MLILLSIVSCENISDESNYDNYHKAIAYLKENTLISNSEFNFIVAEENIIPYMTLFEDSILKEDYELDTLSLSSPERRSVFDSLQLLGERLEKEFVTKIDKGLLKLSNSSKGRVKLFFNQISDSELYCQLFANNHSLKIQNGKVKGYMGSSSAYLFIFDDHQILKVFIGETNYH